MNENGDILASQSIYETGVVSTEVASSGNYYVAVYDSFDAEDYTLTATYSSITGSRETESNDARSTVIDYLWCSDNRSGCFFHRY